MLQASHSRCYCGTTSQSFIYSAVTVSPESAKSKGLTSGELRIGPRRYTLICDEDGTLRQEFPNAMYVFRPSLSYTNPLLYSEVLPRAQITFCRKTSFFGWQRTQRIDTRRLFANFSADQTQGKSNTFSSYVDSLHRNVRNRFIVGSRWHSSRIQLPGYRHRSLYCSDCRTHSPYNPD